MVWLLTSAVSAVAGVVLGNPQTWDAGDTHDAWKNTPPGGASVATLTTPAVGGVGNSGYLRIAIPAVGAPLVPADDTAWTDQGVDIGNYQGISVAFSFYAEDMLPLSSVVYLHSAVSDNTWQYGFANSQVGVWETQLVGFDYDYGNGWSGWGNASDFWNDLANVDWIGVNVQTIGAHAYGIDNWVYCVPEPGAVYLLLAALLSLACAIRHRAGLCPA